VVSVCLSTFKINWKFDILFTVMRVIPIATEQTFYANELEKFCFMVKEANIFFFCNYNELITIQC
jgi:hypothetical protein